jgi:hypothetical protein
VFKTLNVQSDTTCWLQGFFQTNFQESVIIEQCEPHLRHRVVMWQQASTIFQICLFGILNIIARPGATASRKPPPTKRRKLTSSAAVIDTPQSQGITTLTVSEDIQTRVSKVITASSGRLVCTTCHRAINVRPECVILCARYVSSIQSDVLSQQLYR